MAHRPDRPILAGDLTAREMERARTSKLRELSQRRSPQAPGRVSFGTAAAPAAVLRWTCGGGLLGRTSPEQRVAIGGPALVVARLRVPGTTSTRVELRREGSTIASLTIAAFAHQGTTEVSLTAGWWVSIRTPTAHLSEDAEDLSVEVMVT